MALKRKLTKAEFDALTDALKEHYTVSGDGYVLDADDATDLQNALRARTEEAARLKKEKDDAEKERKRLEDEAAETARVAAEAEARRTGDTAALETSWKKKLDDANTANAARETGLQARLKKLLVDNVAIQIAGEISIAPELMLLVIEKRLEADVEAGTTRVLDTDGKPSALTIEDLKKELVANPKYAAIVKASDASGGGSNGTNKSGGANGAKKLSEMTEAEQVELHRKNPAEYQRLRDLK